ncbi:MAG: HAMP domain-containing protein, partial [Anaerolineae bacterium]|nr:HAMP domain-containing protein [Anaerolineae bacterium]
MLPNGTDTVQRFALPASVALPDSVSEALRTRRITASPVAFRAFDFSPFLTLAVPLSNGETRGLLVAEVDLRILWTKVDSIRIEGGSVSIIDQAGVIVAHPNRRRVGQTLDVAAIAPVFTGHTGVTSYRENGQSYLAGYSPITGVMQWGVIVEQQRATALAPVRVIAGLAALVTLISALSLALLLLRIVHRAVQPLEALSQTVATITASGDLSHDLPLTRSDEIGALTDSFNRMLASLRQAQERLQRWNEELERRVTERTAQLEAANQELQREIAVRRQAEAEIKRINRDLVIARDQALDASRAKSAFLANMSHELRTPLNAILGFAQLMARSPAMPPAYQENLQVINRSGEQLLTLINDVLAMSKIEAGQIALNETSFDLHHLLDGLKTMFRLRAASKGLALAFEYSSDLPRYIRTDEDKLRQTLVNLLDNAIKFTPKGSVTLRVRSEADKRHLSSREEGEASMPSPPSSHTFTLHFEVEDTGIGIPPNEVEALFEAFGLAGNGHARPQGAGLGLPISRRFVQLLGGDLAVRSPGVPGQGAIFCFDIPVNQADPAEVQVVRPARQVIGLAPDQPPY